MDIRRTTTFLVSVLVVLLTLTACTSVSSSVEGKSNDIENKIPVLMYHGILTDEEKQLRPNNSSYITADSFEKQMKYLKENGYHTVTVDEMRHFLAGEMQLPRKSVMIQFDDGLRSVYRYAYPIMKEHNLDGVANIITRRTYRDYGDKWDPSRNQYMDKEMLNKISDVFELQSHTNKLHFNLAD
ncbi:polysaccharide deacetylase family protein [Lentibacillus cibarius]|uniref:Polysaccharide deacetylase family protein n=1 Tax=Lentibacillus cibarius TaxID=2583219 RepID=A0A549YIF5_9BACI|nr:polysaccharide deacetylase family protein [Lentibacillus cibarius]TRM11658.1 polysaccharide deacetylase family protein [Lentibacillus cibarius]